MPCPTLHLQTDRPMRWRFQSTRGSDYTLSTLSLSAASVSTAPLAPSGNPVHASAGGEGHCRIDVAAHCQPKGSPVLCSFDLVTITPRNKSSGLGLASSTSNPMVSDSVKPPIVPKAKPKATTESPFKNNKGFINPSEIKKSLIPKK